MSQSERRKKSRKRPLSLVYVELTAGNGGMMRDLSEEGFAVRAMIPLRPGEKTSFQFALSESVRIDGEGEILWVAENGRVAGVQFTQVSPAARGDIQEWLLGPETPPSRREDREKSKPVANPTLEELREEIHTVPARPETTLPSEAQRREPPEKEIVGREEPTPVAEPPSPVADAETPAANFGASEVQELESPEWPAPPAPALPRLTLTPKENRLFHAPVTPRHAKEAADEEEAASARPLPPLPSIDFGETEWPRIEPNLPEISSILIQPSGRASGQTRSTRRVGTAPPWDTEAASGASWTERLSLGSAIATMVVLTLAAGIYVFHRSVGQGLIWLGEAMGGVQQTQPQLSSAPNASAASEKVPATTATGASSAEQPPASGANGSDIAPGRTAVGNPAMPLGNTSINPLPAAPLGGMSPPASTGTEAGQAEYVQAMQILAGKPGRGDNSEALRLLWLSVEKGNPSAELALAEVYWHGRGVARNCEQTRILLTAAARKGSPEAQKRLEQFQSEGCE